MPTSMVGTASAMNIHFQPASPGHAVEPEQRGGDRRAQRDRERQRQGEAGDDAGAVTVGEPIGEEQHHAGEQPGLGDAEQKAHEQEALGADAEGGGAGGRPQVTMMRAIHSRAPTFSNTMLLGTSNRQ